MSKGELESIFFIIKNAETYIKLKGKSVSGKVPDKHLTDDNTDSIYLVMGADPHWSLNDEFERLGYGEYEGGMNDEWIWNKSALRKLSKEELDDIYKRCKESWKK